MDDEYLRVFSVAICFPCKRSSERNQLIAKGKAKDKYCVTDKDLAKLKTVGRVRGGEFLAEPTAQRPPHLTPSAGSPATQTNPRNAQWSQLQLYLVRQARPGPAAASFPRNLVPTFFPTTVIPCSDFISHRRAPTARCAPLSHAPQVEDIAASKHGSLEGADEHRVKLLEARASLVPSDSSQRFRFPSLALPPLAPPRCIGSVCFVCFAQGRLLRTAASRKRPAEEMGPLAAEAAAQRERDARERIAASAPSPSLTAPPLACSADGTALASAACLLDCERSLVPMWRALLGFLSQSTRRTSTCFAASQRSTRRKECTGSSVQTAVLLCSTRRCDV